MSRYFQSENRYRDMAVKPDGRTIYIATDEGGMVQAVAGGTTTKMENPGAILAFTYEGEGSDATTTVSGAGQPDSARPVGVEIRAASPGAPPQFTAGLAALADPATTRAAAEGLTASWLAGHEDLPGIVEQIAVMRQHSDEMWARAGREIAAAYAMHASPLQAFAALPAPPPVRHLYAEPKDPAFLAAQQEFARAHPWFSVRRLDTAHTHFPMLEQPADLAGDLIRFADSLGPTPLV